MREIARECEEDPGARPDGAAHDPGQARGRGRRRAQPRPALEALAGARPERTRDRAPGPPGFRDILSPRSRYERRLPPQMPALRRGPAPLAQQHLRVHVLLLEEALEDGALRRGASSGSIPGPAWAAASSCFYLDRLPAVAEEYRTRAATAAARRTGPGAHQAVIAIGYLDGNRLVAGRDRGGALRRRAGRAAQQDQRLPGARRRHGHQRRLDAPEDRRGHRAHAPAARPRDVAGARRRGGRRRARQLRRDPRPVLLRVLRGPAGRAARDDARTSAPPS